MKQYYINTICHEHVKLGVAGSFTQSDHGGAKRLKRLQRGDWMIFYSPRVAMDRAAASLQAFTAIGQVDDDDVYQVEMTPQFKPWRRNIKFESSSGMSPAKPLLGVLECTRERGNKWGMVFRRGLFKISEHDARVIAGSMKVAI